MGKIFDIYLAKADQPESAACAELSLPATPYQMQDAFDNCVMTSYGMIERNNGQPIQKIENQPRQNEMEMK